MKTAFIINPAAGRGKTAKIWRQLGNIAQGSSYFTTGAGHGERLARDLSNQGYRRLLVLGGDGTLNEVINGMDFSQVQVGIIPTGTGNDFARVLGMPKNPGEALQALLKGRTRVVDIGLINGRRFINTVGVGFDAEVARTTNEEFPYLTGTFAYLISLIKVMGKYKNQIMTIETDTATLRGKMLLAGVGNGCYIGGGMKLIPQAEIDDGLFHLCLLGDVNKLEMLINMPKIFSGKHLNHPKTSSLTAKQIRITTGEPLTVQADGEIIGKTPIEVKIIPQGVEILVP